MGRCNGAFALLGASIASACGGGGASISGEVDGGEVALRSGYFAQDAGAFEGGDGVILVVLSSIDDICAADTDFRSQAEDAADPSELGALWQQTFPPDFWNVQLVLRAADPSEPQAKKTLIGIGWDAAIDQDDRAYGTLTHYTAGLDEAYWSAASAGADDSSEGYFEEWYTDGGTLEIRRHKPDEKIAGTFPTSVVAPADGEDAGEIEISFRVERCVEAERFLF